jgi:hypothetical protein
MQGRSFLESKNIINLKSWLSIPSFKIGEISNIFRRWSDFISHLELFIAPIHTYMYDFVRTRNLFDRPQNRDCRLETDKAPILRTFKDDSIFGPACWGGGGCLPSPFHYIDPLHSPLGNVIIRGDKDNKKFNQEEA